MIIKEFDKVLLKSGKTAYIADVIIADVAYVVDIDKSDGSIETEIIEYNDIERVVADDYSVQS